MKSNIRKIQTCLTIDSAEREREKSGKLNSWNFYSLVLRFLSQQCTVLFLTYVNIFI